MTRQEKRFQMETLIEQWHRSGMSQAEFAQVQNITLIKFRYWLKRCRQSSNGGSDFIQLSGISTGNISLRYPNGVEITLPQGTPYDMIRSLINY